MAYRRLGAAGARWLSRAMPLAGLFAGTAIVSGAAMLALEGPAVPSAPAGTGAAFEGKASDRLSRAGGEQAPTVRIQDTVAMFALPQADARNWMDRPIAPAPVPPAERAKPEAGTPARASSAEPPDRRSRDLPPSRPATLVPAGDRVAAIEAPPSAKPDPQPHRERPSAIGDAFATVRDGAAEFGGRTVDAVADTASTVGDKVSSFGRAAAETLGLR